MYLVMHKHNGDTIGVFISLFHYLKDEDRIIIKDINQNFIYLKKGDSMEIYVSDKLVFAYKKEREE